MMMMPTAAPNPAPAVAPPFALDVNLGDFSAVRDRLRLRLMSEERRPDVGERFYSKRIGETDLHAVVAVDVSSCLPEPDGGTGHALTTPALRDAWMSQGYSEDEIWAAAVAAEGRRGYSVRPMWDVLAGLGGNPDTDPGDCPLFVVSTPDSNFGAAGVLLPYVCAQIAHRVGDPAYILPSSIHECLVLSCENAPEPEELVAMVRSINATVVDGRDILSDHVYRLAHGSLSTVI